ncbi:MAG TPA: hypothetical protein VJ123_04780 [Anaerolineales bacterium]|nr:hypothetical protein [Anaerolineales bacterium]
MSKVEKKKRLRRPNIPMSGAGAGELPSQQGGLGAGLRRPGVEFNPDYRYVIHDLRRIGFLAGSFIVLLIVLSFFLR